jgi:hypothetical protein
MGASLLELCPSLGIDQGGGYIRKGAGRIGSRRSLCLDKNRPTGFQTPQGVVQTTGDGDELGRDRAIEIRSAKICCPLKRAILVQDDALVHKGSPWNSARRVFERRYSARFIMRELRS